MPGLNALPSQNHFRCRLRPHRVGDAIPTSAIGEPVGAVALAAPRWVAATETLQARCEVAGNIDPVDRSATARPIRCFATFGSDSGHQMTPGPQDWALNDEAMKNLGYAQLKKTRDAAMVLLERVYGARPRYTYFTGTSQAGREALTVAQRYPADYDRVIANVPIVS